MAVPPGSHHLQIDTSGTSPARLDTVYQELRSLHLLTSAL
jgi:hypothetical protein